MGPSWKRETVVVVSGMPLMITELRLELTPLPVMASVPPWRKPEAAMFVEDTFAREDDPAVKTPVEVEMVNSAEDVALEIPAGLKFPKRICESTDWPRTSGIPLSFT